MSIPRKMVSISNCFWESSDLNALVILLHLAVRITINQCDLVDFPKVELRNVHPAKDGVDKQLLLGEVPCVLALIFFWGKKKIPAVEVRMDLAYVLWT